VETTETKAAAEVTKTTEEQAALAEKLKKRQERFGLPEAAAAVDPADTKKGKKRKGESLAVEGKAVPKNPVIAAPLDPEEEEKRKKRSMRFAKPEEAGAAAVAAEETKEVAAVEKMAE
jgi:hypothetical protein